MMHTEENDMNNVFFSMKRKDRKITILSMPQQIQMGCRYHYDIIDLEDGQTKIMAIGSIAALEIEKSGIKVGDTIEMIVDKSPPNPPTIRRINESQPIL